MTDETTPDAVAMLQRMHACVVLSENHGDVPRVSSDEVLAALRAVQAERARHAEEVARLEAAHLSDLETIEAWKLASGLECGGDPDGVTPAGMRRYWEGVEADRDSLRDQLRRAEGEREEALRMVDGLRKSEKTARESMVINMRLRDEAQAENVQLKAERDALRSLLPDVRACANYVHHFAPAAEYPVCRAASDRILTALDSRKDGGQ